jgi:hypothetical protein
MGNTSSHPKTKKGKQNDGMFGKELAGIDAIINNVLGPNGKYKNPNYNRNMCEDFSIVLESQLNKHLKVELQDLKDAIYFVPKKDNVHVKGDFIKKDQLCALIADHYERVLKLLVLVQSVYDIENNGNQSIAGICFSNVKVENNNMFVSFCGQDQKDYKAGMNGQDYKDIDFSQLKGLKMLCSGYLEKREKNILLRTMKNMLGNRNMPILMDTLSCGDGLFTGKEYAEMLSLKSTTCAKDKGDKYSKSADINEHELMIQVMRDNAIISPEMCPTGSAHTRFVDMSNVKSREAVRLYHKMHSDYKRGLAKIKYVLEMVVFKDGANWSLKHIDSKTLEKIESDAKRLIIAFYIQSIANFQHLVDQVRDFQDVIEVIR